MMPGSRLTAVNPYRQRMQRIALPALFATGAALPTWTSDDLLILDSVGGAQASCDGATPQPCSHLLPSDLAACVAPPLWFDAEQVWSIAVYNSSFQLSWLLSAAVRRSYFSALLG